MTVAHGDAVEVQAEKLLQTAAAAGATAGSDSNVAVAPAAATVAATIITVETDPSQKCWLARQPRRRAVIHTCAPPYSLAQPTQAPIRIRTTMRVPVEGGNSNRLPA
jgi:hypothetical protein